MIVIGSRVLAAFGADTSKGIGAYIVWVEVTVKVFPISGWICLLFCVDTTFICIYIPVLSCEWYMIGLIIW